MAFTLSIPDVGKRVSEGNGLALPCRLPLPIASAREEEGKRRWDMSSLSLSHLILSSLHTIPSSTCIRLKGTG